MHDVYAAMISASGAMAAVLPGIFSSEGQAAEWAGAPEAGTYAAAATVGLAPQHGTDEIACFGRAGQPAIAVRLTP